jgi:spore maturation protein CgeB
MQVYSAMERSGARFAIIADGKSITPHEVEACRALAASRGGGIAQYLCDDPFAPAYGRSSWKDGVKHFDINFSTKRRIMSDLRAAGASDVRFLWFAFDPVLHLQRSEVGTVPSHLLCNIAFAGSSDKDRLPVFETLKSRVPEAQLRLYSGKWSGSRVLRSSARPAVYGMEYCRAMLAADMCPCLVRHANRDGHVMRTFELPAMGCFMLAERTEEHQELMVEGRHCVMWESAEELADKCRWYASRPLARGKVAVQGRNMIRDGQNTYLDRAMAILRAMGFGPG